MWEEAVLAIGGGYEVALEAMPEDEVAPLQKGEKNGC